MTKEEFSKLPRHVKDALGYGAYMAVMTRGEPAATGHWKAIKAIVKPIARARAEEMR